ADLNLHIGKGEVCVLVGPSGCGKTTTMKMINRLIEPTSGTIFVDGQNIMDVNPIELRRNIGYVIQEIGLFPHMTIAENIATVPLEKKWPRDKIRARVDELLQLVGLDPNIYRQRKPRDLSGGQRQRVGVARAMAADPPVLLMDEPFGALDPINRGKLQNEFLRIQKKIQKTIVFVTHDIDEAIKMGTKIAIMRQGKLVQYDTPENILNAPASNFVINLIGGNRTIKQLNLIRVGEMMKEAPPVVELSAPTVKARELLAARGKDLLFAVEKDGRLAGYLSPQNAREEGQVADVMQEIPNSITPDATLNDALSEMLAFGKGFVCVVDEGGKPVGLVTLGTLMKAVGGNDNNS
ncbi:MAG: betaine/proline/choline family ABC transporter ATP-binding protein, partial [bacterium]